MYRAGQRTEHTHQFNSKNKIELHEVRRSLLPFYKRNEGNFRLHFDLQRFKERYCVDEQEGGNPFRNSQLLNDDADEWIQRWASDEDDGMPALLCCPEDVHRCEDCKGQSRSICDSCSIPLCVECAQCIVHGRRKEIPMALCNDNFWGYTSDLIFKYQVTWLEAAIVQPCWTTMMVCYVEGDYGHLLGEKLQQQEFRTKVRGTAHSFHMPWEEIVTELHRHGKEKDLMNVLPRRPEALKYILRVHLRVDRYSMERVLRQLTVRPFVLLQLLYFLIDHNHVVFRGRGSAQNLRKEMQAAIEQHYPLDATQNTLPEQDRKWHLPADFLDCVETSGMSRKHKVARLIKEKNATPGDGAGSADTCLSDGRPSFISTGVSTQSCSDPATIRTGAVLRHGECEVGDLTAQTGHTMIPQWHAQYFSQILPFVIPYMVSGPDFTFHENASRWRRKDKPGHLTAPRVAASKFVAGFARRCESQARQSWVALPIMRSVVFRYNVETGALCIAPFYGRRGSATDTSAGETVRMAQKLCETLWTGKVRYGNIRVPLNGDTTRLALAEGLTVQERKLARMMAYKAQNMPGTGEVRLVMAHGHWGARVNFGDCLFFTISPNEKHSALVLKLSRYRRNDPCVQYGTTTAHWKSLCGMPPPSITCYSVVHKC